MCAFISCNNESIEVNDIWGNFGYEFAETEFSAFEAQRRIIGLVHTPQHIFIQTPMAKENVIIAMKPLQQVLQQIIDFHLLLIR